jgi:hypothetical protein
MTPKQNFLVYARLSWLLAEIKKKMNVDTAEALKIMLSKEIITKLENIDNGYYLESSAYLENELI